MIPSNSFDVANVNFRIHCLPVEFISEYQNDEVMSDTSEEGTVINNYYGDYYETDGHYDYSYSARIRRFHRPVWSIGYYGGLYTDYYWYSYNPYHCGMSIYYGYNYFASDLCSFFPSPVFF